MMNHIWMKIFSLLCASIATTSAQAAVDSYRFMHVTISTPWYIFLFLLMGIFAPFVLMAVLAWASAVRKSKSVEADPEHKPSVE
jgi:purine-cytosine permease-like protein